MDELKKTLAATLFFGFIAGALAVSMPLFLDSQGFSLSGIGSILAAATLAGGLIGVYIGAHTDISGRKKMLSALTFLQAGAALLLLLFKNVFSYLAAESGRKFSSNTRWALFLSRITDLTTRAERGKYLGYFTAAFGLSFAFAHFASGWVFQQLGPDALFLLVSALSLLMAVFILTFKEAPARKRSPKPRLSLGILKTRNGIANSIVSFMNGSQRSIIYGFAIYLFMSRTYSFTPEQIGLYTSIFLFVWGVSSYFLGKLTDTLGSLKTLLYGSMVNASIWVAAAFFQQWEVFFFLMLTENLTYPLYGVSTIKISSMLAHHENIGRDINIFAYFDILGAVIGVFIAGLLAEISFSYVFLMRAFMTISSAAVAYIFITLDDGS
ncbi:MFS transporter [Candidatus Micrarchaeota archaeon]|nr:MFS transporter [Candidatus Micrarchaeota archaeon]MBD3418230.1 MFS transporter [Candidatus Micrarchaeota archaeon]